MRPTTNILAIKCSESFKIYTYFRKLFEKKKFICRCMVTWTMPHNTT